MKTCSNRIKKAGDKNLLSHFGFKTFWRVIIFGNIRNIFLMGNDRMRAKRTKEKKREKKIIIANNMC